MRNFQHTKAWTKKNALKRLTMGRRAWNDALPYLHRYFDNPEASDIPLQATRKSSRRP